MKSIYQPGSDGYAQAKAVRAFCIAISVLFAATVILVITPIGGLLHKDFIAASAFMKIIGFILVIGEVYLLWTVLKKVMSEEIYSGTWVYFITVIGWLLAGGFLTGFNLIG